MKVQYISQSSLAPVEWLVWLVTVHMLEGRYKKKRNSDDGMSLQSQDGRMVYTFYLYWSMRFSFHKNMLDLCVYTRGGKEWPNHVNSFFFWSFGESHLLKHVFPPFVPSYKSTWKRRSPTQQTVASTCRLLTGIRPAVQKAISPDFSTFKIAATRHIAPPCSNKRPMFEWWTSGNYNLW